MHSRKTTVITTIKCFASQKQESAKVHTCAQISTETVKI